MQKFEDTPVAFSTSDGRRCANRELAEEIQFYLDIQNWFKGNPIDRKLEIQPDPARFADWLHGHRGTLMMLIGRMHDSRP